MSLGTKIKNRRLDLKMTQVELAKKIGVAQTYITYLEKDTRTPSNTILKKISKALRLPIKDLFLEAYPDAKNMLNLNSQDTQAFPKFLQELKNNKILRKKHAIKDQDIEMLANLQYRGEASSVKDYIFLLEAIRKTLK